MAEMNVNSISSNIQSLHEQLTNLKDGVAHKHNLNTQPNVNKVEFGNGDTFALTNEQAKKILGEISFSQLV
jgi:hypothetical protein